VIRKERQNGERERKKEREGVKNKRDRRDTNIVRG